MSDARHVVGCRDRTVNKKSVKMGRDFRFINSRIKYLQCAEHGRAAITAASKNIEGPVLKMFIDSR